MDKKVKTKAIKEFFCLSCESRLLTKWEHFGPICKSCYQKTRRKDPLMQGAIRKRLVTIVPAICPHDENCKYERKLHFNVVVFNEKLDPIKIEGPFAERHAQLEAKRIQEKIDRRRRGRGGDRG